MVGPTPNPPCRLSSILFNKYDFPVLYIPATEIMPNGPESYFRKSQASSLISNTIGYVRLIFGDDYISFPYCRSQMEWLLL